MRALTWLGSVAALALFMACGDSVTPEQLVATIAEPAGANCAAGGVAIETGRDDNSNGELDPSEVTSTTYVCQPLPAAPRELVTVVNEPAGANCAEGGEAIEIGLDVNDNGTLDAGEITSTSYVCAAAPGVAVLVAVVGEPAGDNCPAGGQAIETGADTNGNGVLDESEVASTSYVCSGADGSNGSNGERALVRVDAEPEGPNCSGGGSAIHVGLDTNNDGILENNEITATTYLCGPPPNPTVIYGDVTVVNSQQLAQLDGVQVVTGSLSINVPAPISLPSLQHVGYMARIDGTGAVSLPNLIDVSSALEVTTGGLLDLSSLVSAQSVSLSGTMTGVSLPVLGTNSFGFGQVVIQGASLTSVSLPQLTNGSISIDSNCTTECAPQLTSISLPAFESGEVEIAGAGATAVALPAMTSGSLAVQYSPNASSISVPLLASGGVDATSLPSLAELDLPSLVTGGFYINDDAILTTISAPLFVGDATSSVTAFSAPLLSELHLEGVQALESLHVQQCPVLTAIDAADLTAVTYFTIENNATFPTCAAQALAAQADATNITISGNDDAAICP